MLSRYETTETANILRVYAGGEVVGNEIRGSVVYASVDRIIIRKSVASGIQDVRLGSHFIF